MNIPWFKNYWYWFAVVVVFGIIFVAYKSTSVLSANISVDGKTSIVFEIIFRALFNPLWVLFLWFCDKGRKMNSEFHHDILKELKGVIKQAQDSNQTTINVKTLGDIILNNHDVEEMIRKNLDEGVNITPGI